MTRYLIAGFAVAILAGCAAPVTVGSRPADVPPRLTTATFDNKTLIWNDPSAFGPVPASEAARGAQVCGSLNTKDARYKALGYHPRAQDQTGKPFPTGGFYCVAE